MNSDNTQEPQEAASLQPFNTCGPCGWMIVEENDQQFCTSPMVMEDEFEFRHGQRDSRINLVAGGKISTRLARTNSHGEAIYHCSHHRLAPALEGKIQGTGNPEVTEAPSKGKLSSFFFVLGLGALVLMGAYQGAVMLWNLGGS